MPMPLKQPPRVPRRRTVPPAKAGSFQVIGYHYHNKDKDRSMIGAEYVRQTFMTELEFVPMTCRPWELSR